MKNIIKIQVLFFCIFLIFSISCKKDKGNVLNNFYDKLENRIEKAKLLKFKNAPIDSSEYTCQVFYHEYRLIYAEEVDSNKNVLSYLEEIKITKIGIPRDLYLIYEFHNRLNRKNHTVEDYEKIYRTNYRKRANKSKREREMYRKESLDIILRDKQRWTIGDTIKLILPIETGLVEHVKSTNHKLYPYTLDYSDAEDTLKLEGVLIDKISDSFDLIFKLKFLKISNDDVFMQGSKYKVGDEFNLSLKTYGRPIE